MLKISKNIYLKKFSVKKLKKPIKNSKNQCQKISDKKYDKKI